jgi:hypothetical protein
VEWQNDTGVESGLKKVLVCIPQTLARCKRRRDRLHPGSFKKNLKEREFMKKFFVLASLCLLAACSKTGDTTAANPLSADGQGYTDGNLASALTRTQWCAQNDSDRDGQIGAYTFRNDGTGVWQGMDRRTRRPYDQYQFQWQVSGNRLYMSQDQYTVTFTNNGHSLRMSWYNVQDNRLSYAAVPCRF